MPSRLIAFFLALVMCWSGFMIQDQPGAVATVAIEHAESQGSIEPEAPLSSGSAHERQFGELPASGPAETLADLQTLLMDGAPAPESGLLMARPGPYAALTPPAPYLDALQRPPCATPVVA